MPNQIKVWRTQGFESLELQRGHDVTRRVPPHWHDDYQLCLVHGGAGELFYRGQSHPNPAQSLFIVHPGEVHSNRATHENGCDFRTVNVAPELLKQAAEAVGDKHHGHPFFPSPVLRDDHTLRRFQHLHQLLESPAARLERDVALLETLTHLVRHHAQDPLRPHKTGHEPKAVKIARDYLEAHYAEDVPLEELAHTAGLSAFYLTRVFKQTLGIPPHAFQIQVRLAHAQRLLRTGEPLAKVAVETGFADQSHFTRRFKRLVGVTPGAYSKNVQYREHQEA